jgi:hypothetical protein
VWHSPSSTRTFFFFPLSMYNTALVSRATQASSPEAQAQFTSMPLLSAENCTPPALSSQLTKGRPTESVALIFLAPLWSTTYCRLGQNLATTPCYRTKFGTTYPDGSTGDLAGNDVLGVRIRCHWLFRRSNKYHDLKHMSRSLTVIETRVSMTVIMVGIPP